MMTRPFPWPFARRQSRPPAHAPTIEAIYGTIVAQARRPDFYQRFGVPDTVNGRFDMVVLHLWMVLRRLRVLGASDIAQAVFDHFCNDMDGNLREMGVGDLAVPKRMLKFGEAFYGRSRAYDAAIAAKSGKLAAALARNVFLSDDSQEGMQLAKYVGDALGALDACEGSTLLSGVWQFPAPVATRVESRAQQ
jgi:cytochrome b pre-mRNA-processing protein 3